MSHIQGRPRRPFGVARACGVADRSVGAACLIEALWSLLEGVGNAIVIELDALRSAWQDAPRRQHLIMCPTAELAEAHDSMNDLERFFHDSKGRLIHKWQHYFEIYDRHFSRYRGKRVNVVEIGVYRGGSLQMWKHYFGPQARIYGIDIDPACAEFAEDQVEIIIGSQEDREFLRTLTQRIPVIDILIDDGGHTMKQQIATFEELFPHVASDGVYLCEDLHTSYWKEYGGGYREPETFIEYAKNFIDYMHAWRARKARRKRWYESPAPELKVSDFTRSAHSLHFYESVLVIEKRPTGPPTDLKSGGGNQEPATMSASVRSSTVADSS